MSKPQPMQPVVIDKDGVARFQENPIVRWLLDIAMPYANLNTIDAMNFSDEDRSQLAQLIGYSVSGYGDLSYAVHVKEADEAADAAAEAVLKDHPK